MSMSIIPAGEFLMGSPVDEEDREDGETQHLVRLGQPLLMGCVPVTQAHYAAVMRRNPSAFKEPCQTGGIVALACPVAQ